MTAKRKPGDTFAATVTRLETECPEPSGPTVPWCQPIRDGFWIDDAGVRWRLRGPGLLEPKQVRRLFADASVTVLHCYGPTPSVLETDARTELLARIEEFIRGEAAPYSSFDCAEFRDVDRQVMIVVEEHC